MKKKLFFLAAATIALASCSNEDVVEVNKGNAIDFRASIGTGVGARGLETNTGNLGQFNVVAINNGATYFADLFKASTSDDNVTTYNSDVAYYWPGDGSAVDFYAYSYYTGKTDNKLNALDAAKYGTVNITSEAHTIAFTAQDEVANQVDLVATSAQGTKTNATTGQKLTFEHALTQIRLKAKNENANYKYTVAGVKIGKVNNAGTYTFATAGDNTSTSAWNDLSGTQVYTVGLTDNVVLANEAADIMGIAEGATGLMTVPQTLTPWNPETKDIDAGTYFAVLVNITMTGSNTQIYPDPKKVTDTQYAYTYVAVPANTTWEKGKCYTYTLDFSAGAGFTEDGTPILGDAIFFSDVEVTEWNQVSGPAVNVK